MRGLVLVRTFTISAVILIAGGTTVRAQGTAAAADRAGAAAVEQWGTYEVELKGPDSGNPFVDVQLSATFTCDDRKVTATGFYDGDGVYRVRVMPDRQGEWRYETQSNRPELSGKSVSFTCGPA